MALTQKSSLIWSAWWRGTTGLSLPVMKVLELLPGALPGCCFIIESSFNNIWIQIRWLWFSEPRHYKMLLFPAAGRMRPTITFSAFFYRNLNMAPLRKSFCSPKPQQAFTARQHDLVNPELFYVPIVCVDRRKIEVRTEGWEVESRSPCLSEPSNTKKNEHLCWSAIISSRPQIHHAAEREGGDGAIEREGERLKSSMGVKEVKTMRKNTEESGNRVIRLSEWGGAQGEACKTATASRGKGGEGDEAEDEEEGGKMK